MDESIDFEKIKLLLQHQNDLNSYIKDPANSKESVFLYWALDSLKHVESTPIFFKNKKLLKEIQKQLISEPNIESGLKEYSAGFILGVHEFTIRTIEANVDHYQEYQELVRKLESWKKIGFSDPQIEKYFEETMKGIKEIDDWQKSKTDEYYPILFQLINSSRHKRSEKQVLKFLQKRCSKDTMVFFLLSGVLRTNPQFHEKVFELCGSQGVSFEELSEKLYRVLLLLRDETSSSKVQHFIQMFMSK